MPETNAAQFAKLESRVDAIETGLHGLTKQISGLADKIDQRGQTPWSLIISALALCFTAWGAFGWLIYAPVVKDQTRIEADIKALETQIVPRAEHMERWRQQERAGDDMRKRLDRLEEDRFRRTAEAR
jgi:hypothetical protein